LTTKPFAKSEAELKVGLRASRKEVWTADWIASGVIQIVFGTFGVAAAGGIAAAGGGFAGADGARDAEAGGRNQWKKEGKHGKGNDKRSSKNGRVNGRVIVGRRITVQGISGREYTTETFFRKVRSWRHTSGGRFRVKGYKIK
jgi:hypothetical protein